MNRINHNLNERLVKCAVSKHPQKLRDILETAFKSEVKGSQDPSLVEYYMDAFIHSSVGLMNNEMIRHLKMLERS
ncbi:hypothetical protein NCTGTJJY_CDS0039 [Serratia phage 92A1]|nr:hypothetical protein NCTGTJJY_CDS0039 [Serratia phage 92A1]